MDLKRKVFFINFSNLSNSLVFNIEGVFVNLDCLIYGEVLNNKYWLYLKCGRFYLRDYKYLFCGFDLEEIELL